MKIKYTLVFENHPTYGSNQYPSVQDEKGKILVVLHDSYDIEFLARNVLNWDGKIELIKFLEKNQEVFFEYIS